MSLNLKNIDEFPAYMSSLTNDDWQPLFDLIPEIEKAGDFGTIEGGEEIRPGVFSMPYSNPGPLVWKFEKLAYEMGIVIQFEWMQWDEGRELASGSDFSKIDHIDLITCCMLITAILRNNRFCDGALMDFFECGLGLKVLKRMRDLVDLPLN